MDVHVESVTNLAMLKCQCCVASARGLLLLQRMLDHPAASETNAWTILSAAIALVFVVAGLIRVVCYGSVEGFAWLMLVDLSGPF